MVRSASAAVAILAAALLAGCSTTQQEASRLQLGGARIRATEQRLRVTTPNPDVRVHGVTLLTGHGGSAIVVRLQSTAAQILTDLPISVGVLGRDHSRTYLNGAVSSDYFDSHVSAIPAGGALTWVFTTHRHLAAADRPFATIGRPPPGFSSARHLPAMVVSERGGPGQGPLELTVRNPTSVPQYGLQVFATVQGRGGYLAAGKAEITHLGTGSSQDVHINLVGRASAKTPTLTTTPTIFG